MVRKRWQSGLNKVKSELRSNNGIAFSCEDHLKHILAHKGIPFIMLMARKYSKTYLMSLLEQNGMRNISKTVSFAVLDKPNVKKRSKRCDEELVRYEKIFQSWS